MGTGQVPEHAVDLVHDVAQLVVGVGGGQLELHNQPVDFVDADGDGQSLLHGMLDQTLCVQHHLDEDTHTHRWHLTSAGTNGTREHTVFNTASISHRIQPCHTTPQTSPSPPHTHTHTFN